MTTKACCRFIDQNGRNATVYIHENGNPSLAWQYFSKALQSGLAFELPRYHAQGFAAAFVASNKTRPGGVYLAEKWNNHVEISYLYKLTINNAVLILKIEKVCAPDSGSLKPSRWKRDTVYHGPLHRVIFASGGPAWQGSTGMKISQINKILQAPASRETRLIEDLIAELDLLGLANMPGDTFANLSNIVEGLRS